MEIALNEALRGWHPPVSGQLHCPFCQSTRIYQRCQRKNGMTHGCRDCSEPFSEELVQQCRCVRPGKFAKCLSCPQYQFISQMMKFNIEQLRQLSEGKVDQIMSHPGFYQQQFSLQQFLPEVKLKHYAERETTSDSTEAVGLSQLIDGNTEQLSLFD